MGRTGHKPNVVMCSRTTENRIPTAKESSLCSRWDPLARRCCNLSAQVALSLSLGATCLSKSCPPVLTPNQQQCHSATPGGAKGHFRASQ